ncbi:hypothetical protein GGI12_004875 [Dipsacomyces acuminosporus]|nr:hypothetical protein GGI12_004875 [Dipsacomyces acuminosporus]
MPNEELKPKPEPKPQQPNAPKSEIPATRLFKVLNPELYMKPNRWIMCGGVVAMAGIVLWLGSGELKHRQEQQIIKDVSESKPRAQSYQERMAERKRSAE